MSVPTASTRCDRTGSGPKEGQEEAGQGDRTKKGSPKNKKQEEKDKKKEQEEEKEEGLSRPLRPSSENTAAARRIVPHIAPVTAAHACARDRATGTETKAAMVTRAPTT